MKTSTETVTRDLAGALAFVKTLEGRPVARPGLEPIAAMDAVSDALDNWHDAEGDAVERATGRLDDALSAVVVDCLFDGLTMAGVTDRGRMTEIAATVLRGGPGLPEDPAFG